MDVTELARRLIAFDTINPEGHEAEAMVFCEDILRAAGFDCQIIPQGPGRSNLIAMKGNRSGRALGFTGHLDTVPLGGTAWHYPPHEGVIADGKLYGRGSTDMKGGVAAFLCAVLNAPVPPGGVSILLTAGEETGSDGARTIVKSGPLPPIGALIVAEPTANRAVPGHKGALWLRLVFHGVTAHGSAPTMGVNAIGLAMKALDRVTQSDLGAVHPVMGGPSLNIGTISGGLNTNSVPDRCEVTLDLRSVPGIAHDTLVTKIEACLPKGTEIARIIDLPAVWTDPADPWLAKMTRLSAIHASQPGDPMAMSYFSDASIFTPALGGVPTVILGPGEPGLAHKTDEYVELSRLNEAVEIYRAALGQWEG